MSRPDPWRELRRLPHLRVYIRALAPGVWGLMQPGVIWLDSGLLQVERRCTLAHELEHVRRQHDGCQDPREERRVHAAAARYLLPDVQVVADALAWAHGCLVTAAEELWVDPDTLRHRLDPRDLRPGERAVITRRLADLAEAA